MAVYYVVFDQATSGLKVPPSSKWEGVTVLEAPNTSLFVKMEAGSVAEAQRGIEHFFGGSETVTPVVVLEAAWKES